MPNQYTTAPTVVGDRFNRLTVIGPAPKHGPHVSWTVQCDCGTIIEVTQGHLRSGHTRSCGCLLREFISAMASKHGRSKTSEHFIWAHMRARCQNLRDKAYSRYGGRGITVCPEWESFEQFFADMGPRPSTAHTLDRIDNNGPYAPWNCRWATYIEQSRNRRNNRVLVHDGIALTVAEWAGRVGIKAGTLHYRLNMGWDSERVLTTPVKRAVRQPILF